MGRFARSWELAKTSWAVLKKDRELMWLPVLSFLVSAAIALVVMGIVFLAEYDSSTGWDEFELGTGSYILLIVAYFAVSIVAIFFNAALVSGARERLHGGDPTVSSAVGHAMTRIHVIIPWAITTVTVGLILRSIRENAGQLGRFLASIVDMAWNVVTFLAIPIVVVEQLGPFAAVKRSVELFKRTWGENLIARMGLGLLGFVAVLPGAIVGGLLAVTGVDALVVIGIVAAVVWIALVIVVMTSLTAVFQAALYEYAVTGAAPAEFAGSGLEGAFETRGERRQSSW